MKKILFAILAIFCFSFSFSQVTLPLRADSIRLYKQGGFAELILENSTKGRTDAFLKNIGNGRTGYNYAIDSAWKLNDSTLVFRRGDGNDTILISGSGEASDVFKVASVAALRSSTNYGAGKFMVTGGYWVDGDGGSSYWYWDASSGLADNGVDVIKPSAFTDEIGRWRKLYSGSLRAAEAGIKYDGSDQTATLNTVLAISQVKSLVFDNIGLTDVTISGAVTCPSTSVIYFFNSNKIIGTGTWTGGLIECDLTKQCFAPTVSARNLENRIVSVKWAGAIPAAAGGFDSRPAFLWARNAGKLVAVSTGVSGLSGVYAQGEIVLTDEQYYISDSIWFNNIVSIKSINSAGRWAAQQTRIFTPINKSGFKFSRNEDGTGCRAAFMENIHLESAGLSTDTLQSGIWTNTLNHFKNVSVSNFGRYGFEITTRDTGDCSNSIFDNCSAFYNKLSGFYAKGQESSNMLFIACNARSNGRCGFEDDSFLGNTYLTCHAASAGGRPGQMGWVRLGGYEYVSIARDNVNITPGVTAGWEAFWQRFPDHTIDTLDVPAYVNGTWYPITSSYAVTNVVAGSVFLACYSEGGSAGMILNQYSIAFGGDIGTGLAQRYMGWITQQLYETWITSGVHVPDRTDSSYIKLSNISGITLGETSNPNAINIKYIPSEKYVYFYNSNSLDNWALRITTPFSSPTPYGITTIRQGVPVFSDKRGFYGLDATNSGRGRNILFGLLPPTTEEHAAGDKVIYTGTDSTIDHYLCTVTGTPGTWQTIKTGSGAWNLYNTNGSLLNNRTVSLNSKILTFSDGANTTFNIRKGYSELVQMTGDGFQRYGYFQLDTNRANAFIHTVSGKGAGLYLNNSNDVVSATLTVTNSGGSSGMAINEDSTTFYNIEGPVVIKSVEQGTRFQVGDFSGVGETHQVQLITEGVLKMWAPLGSNQIHFLGTTVEAGGFIGLNGILATNIIKQPSVGLGIWAVGTDSLILNTRVAHSSLSNYADPDDFQLLYTNYKGEILRSGIPAFESSYITSVHTLDAIGIEVNDSTYGIKGTGVQQSAGDRIKVTKTITSADNLYSLSVNVANLATGTPDNTKFLRGDSTWAVPAGGVTTLNTLTGATQTFATGTTGTDFGISSTGTTHTFNIPDASAANRGLVTTGTQTLAGAKTFSSDVIVPDEAYDGTAWNGSLEVPTKNALRDKIETLSGVSDGDKGSITVTGSGATWTIDNDAVLTAMILADNVTLSKIVDIAPGGVIGNIGTTTQNPQDIAAVVVIGTGTVSNATTMDIILTTINTLYDEIQIHFYNVRPATDGVNLSVRVSTDGGSTYDATAGNYEWGYVYSAAGTGFAGSASATQVDLVQGIDNGTTQGLHGVLYLHSPDNTSQYPALFGQVQGMTTANALVGTTFTGVRKAAQDTDAIRFYMSSGNIYGAYKIVGIRKPGA